MSGTTGLIAIKGNHEDNLEKIFGYFDLVDTKKQWIATNKKELDEILKKTWPKLPGDQALRFTWVKDSWTVIDNSDFSLSESEALKKLTIDFQTPVFYLFTQGTSANYGFGYFDANNAREFHVDNGTVIENSGTPIAAEAKYPVNENTAYDQIHGIAKELGIDYEDVLFNFSIDRIIVKLLKNSDKLNEQIALAAEEYKKLHPKKEKPEIKTRWWKFW